MWKSLQNKCLWGPEVFHKGLNKRSFSKPPMLHGKTECSPDGERGTHDKMNTCMTNANIAGNPVPIWSLLCLLVRKEGRKDHFTRRSSRVTANLLANTMYMWHVLTQYDTLDIHIFKGTCMSQRACAFHLWISTNYSLIFSCNHIIKGQYSVIDINVSVSIGAANLTNVQFGTAHIRK